MNKDHLIYEMSETQIAALNGERHDDESDGFDEEQIAVLREDVARLDGYLKGRADSDSRRLGKGRGVALGRGSGGDLAR